MEESGRERERSAKQKLEEHRRMRMMRQRVLQTITKEEQTPGDMLPIRGVSDQVVTLRPHGRPDTGPYHLLTISKYPFHNRISHSIIT